MKDKSLLASLSAHDLRLRFNGEITRKQIQKLNDSDDGVINS